MAGHLRAPSFMKGSEMTWLEIMDTLDKMPRHLLKQDAELWHCDANGNATEVLAVDNLVSPLNEPDSKEWEEGGCLHLTLQAYDKPAAEERPERRTFLVDVDTIVSQTFRVEAASREDAQAKVNAMLEDDATYEQSLMGNWVENRGAGAVNVRQIQEWDDGDVRYPLLAPKQQRLFAIEFTAPAVASVIVRADDMGDAREKAYKLERNKGFFIDYLEEAMADAELFDFLTVSDVRAYCDDDVDPIWIDPYLSE